MPTRRRVFLINQKFQLRFAFYVCSWVIALSFAYPLILSKLFDTFIRYLALDPLGPALAELEKARQDLMILLIAMQGVLVGSTFFISLFLSHKIAGPLYKLRLYFQGVQAGNICQKLSFRKGDYFLELASDYNAMVESIEKRILRSREGIQLAIPKLEGVLKCSGPEAKNDLEVVLQLLRESEKSHLNP